MKYGDFVQYLIVYDDRFHSALVPMSATNPDGITIGLLFVSEATGLRKFYTLDFATTTSRTVSLTLY